MSDPSVGVVLLNWNGCDDTERALDSLLAATPRPAHVVVVDNGSADDSVARLRSWIATHAPARDSAAPWATIIAETDNRGFAGGNNIGLAALARLNLTHFLLLNNDAMVAEDYFERIAEALREYPDAALIGCAIYYHPERERVWFAGGREIPQRALMLHRYELPDSMEPQETPFVTGCAMIISRMLYEREGGLAECYNPIYWEDTDYSHRARTRGWRVMLVPRAKVFHRVGSSFGGEKITPQVAFWQNRNRGYYVRRNYRGFDRIAAVAYLIATKPAKALVELARGRPAMASAIIRGFALGLTADCS
ncbi:MAG: glycosyltransferase family 2 protein [Gemmatimonadota bacterium]|nr:glycosyltransferase family 2 protein [Gemmatimonadota bacterium]